jgi:uncharacterized protein YgiM (DUF1202 family)
MKKNYALVLGVFLSTGLMAQTNSTVPAVPDAAPAMAPATPAPAPTVAPVTPAPVATAKPVKKTKAVAKKPVAKRPAVVEKTVSLQPGPAVVDATHVNVRGRSTILSEVLTQMNKGDTVTVIEQVENKWAKDGDMRQWARIAYPTNAGCWVFASFIDANKAVTAPKLNLRGGPGENYSIVGRITKGTTVTVTDTKGEWLKIVPPDTATAYISAIYLKQDATLLAAAQPAAVKPPVEPVSTNPVVEVEPIATNTTDIASATTGGDTNELAAFLASNAGVTNEAGSNDTEMAEAPDEPLPPRIVMREGIVRNATSIQAPSYYGLAGMDTGRTIDYLYTTSTNLNLNLYNGLHVIVTGEESIDERWPNTPVLTLQRIQVIDE